MPPHIIHRPVGHDLSRFGVARATGAVPPRNEPKIELIPHTMHSKNARAVLTDQAWSRVRRISHERNGRMCCECGDWIGALECHEAWRYEWRGRSAEPVMKMTALVSLCHLCHMGKHLGFAKRNGELKRVKTHLKRLYGISETRLDAIVSRAELKVARLSLHTFQLDLTYLNDERFADVHKLMGRKFSRNEIDNCRPRQHLFSMG